MHSPKTGMTQKILLLLLLLLYIPTKSALKQSLFPSGAELIKNLRAVE
jgi:hypothetical protein